MDDIEWMDRGRCQGSENPDIFFPRQRGRNARQKSSLAAKAICEQCPVIAECLHYAVENHMPGIWGGTLDEERTLRKRVVAA